LKLLQNVIINCKINFDLKVGFAINQVLYCNCKCTYFRYHGPFANARVNELARDAELGLASPSSMRLPFHPLLRAGGCAGIRFDGGAAGAASDCFFASRSNLADGGCGGGVGPFRTAAIFALALTTNSAKNILV
jgi:hypothetical protein